LGDVLGRKRKKGGLDPEVGLSFLWKERSQYSVSTKGVSKAEFSRLKNFVARAPGATLQGILVLQYGKGHITARGLSNPLLWVPVGTKKRLHLDQTAKKRSAFHLYQLEKFPSDERCFQTGENKEGFGHKSCY